MSWSMKKHVNLSRSPRRVFRWIVNKCLVIKLCFKRTHATVNLKLNTWMSCSASGELINNLSRSRKHTMNDERELKKVHRVLRVFFYVPALYLEWYESYACAHDPNTVLPLFPLLAIWLSETIDKLEINWWLVQVRAPGSLKPSRLWSASAG